MKFAHYHSLLAIDPELATLVKAVINNEARYVSAYPYCRWRFSVNTFINGQFIGGAFQPPPESGLPPTYNAWADGVTVNPYALFSRNAATNLKSSVPGPSIIRRCSSVKCAFLHRYSTVILNTFSTRLTHCVVSSNSRDPTTQPRRMLHSWMQTVMALLSCPPHY